MKTYPNEPLTIEERELAQLTARLGPQGEPSPTLDARILAAAHAAHAAAPARTRRRPRWPVAMGLAASVVFAVGIAWQLRPLQPVQVVAEAPSVSEQADRAAEAPAADAAAMSAPVQPQVLPQPVAEPAPASAPASEIAAQSAVPQPGPPRRALGDAAASKPAGQVAKARGSDTYARPAPPAPRIAPAPAPAPAPAVEASREPPLAFAPDPASQADAAPAPPAGVAAEATAPREVSATAAKPSPTRRDNKSSAYGARAQESAALDRIEVSGTRPRRTDLQVPVSADAQLAVNEWLERVRTRYGLGDADAARQSLLLFVKDHPSEPVPEDLEPLLDK